MKKTNQKGFTLIELLVVIAIIGLLSTMAVVALNNAREKSRNAKRVADVKQIQTALEMYYNSCNQYPPIAAPGSLVGAVATGCTDTFSKFLSQVPVNPKPYDGTCPGAAINDQYIYSASTTAGAACTLAGNVCSSYTIQYCLGSDTGGITAGMHAATPAGMF